MKKILLVKTSSLGDVVHNFPAVSDIRHGFAGAVVDWIVEEAYVPLVEMHPGVHRAIPVALRRWRRNLLGPETWREIAQWRHLVGAQQYDAVIDTQGLVKSALIAAAASGPRHGFDAASARERLAANFYSVTHHVSRSQHAVARNRELVSAALGFQPRELPDYGLAPRESEPGKRPRVVFLHATSRPEKLWPEQDWIALGGLLEQAGFDIALPWGNDLERVRSERIGTALAHSEVPPSLGLARLADLLGAATAVVGVDTGLVHLAAALGKTVVALYCASDPRLTGTYAAPRATNLGAPGHPPAPQDVMRALESGGVL